MGILFSKNRHSLVLEKIKESEHIPYMSYTSTLTSKNQTTIPKAIVEALKIKPSATLCYDVEDDGSVRITAKSASFMDLAGTFPRNSPAKPVTVEQMKAAVRSEAVRRSKKQNA